MLAADVDEQISLHLRRMIATGACVGGRCPRLRVRLQHVLHESALLNEALGTHVADIRFVSSVLLHMVEHRVLTGLDDSAVGAHELPLLVPVIDDLRGGHRDWLGVRRRPRFNFWLRLARRPEDVRLDFLAEDSVRHAPVGCEAIIPPSGRGIPPEFILQHRKIKTAAFGIR